MQIIQWLDSKKVYENNHTEPIASSWLFHVSLIMVKETPKSINYKEAKNKIYGIVNEWWTALNISSFLQFPFQKPTYWILPP